MNIAKFRALLARAVLLPLILALVLGGVLLWAVNDLRNVADWADRTDQAIFESNYLLKLIIDMEAGLRGYVIAGQDSFLDPYNQAVQLVPGQFDELQRHFEGDRGQELQLSRIRDAYEVWRRYSLALIGQRKADPAAAQSLAVSLQGRQFMDNLRDEIADFVRVADRIRTQREQAEQRRIKLLLYVIEGLTMILGITLAAFTRSSMLRLSSEFRQSVEDAERRTAELQIEQQRNVALIGASSTSVWRADAEGRFEWFSPQWYEITGLTESQSSSSGWIEAVHPDDRANMRQAWMKAVQNRGPFFYWEWRLRTKEGVYRYFATRAVPVFNPDHTVREWVGTVMDIDDRKRREEYLELTQHELEGRVAQRTAELRDANNSLRELSAILMHSQDDERRRIARELHDSIGQLAVALGMNLSRIENDLPRLNADAANAVSESSAILTELTNQVRTISHLLHPPLLEEVGLDAAIQWFTDGFSQRSGIQVSVDIPPNLQRLDKNMEIAIFRVLQECLTNIHRHSGGKSARIRIAADQNQVSIEVGDDGSGIPAEKRELVNSTGLSGVGLRGMRERLRAFGGTLDVRSSSAGTTVTAVFPLIGAQATALN